MSEDHEAIRHLLYRYCELMDAGDFVPLAALFADAVMLDDVGNVVAEGSRGVQALYERGTRLHDGSPRTRHLTSNSIIDVDQAAGIASARSVYVVFQATQSLALQPIISGRYRDRFARVDDGTWHFTERSFSVDLVGDLSQHLRYDVPS
ncbi:MAG: nuclear transport factor 2 family protein [Actinomycetota bacterium]|nr:nuclear transport factor 2 family protein [Actinomycetota bacterium]